LKIGLTYAGRLIIIGSFTSLDVIDISGKHLLRCIPRAPLPPFPAREVGFKASLLLRREVWREVFFISGDV
jgi:hypothetical protein